MERRLLLKLIAAGVVAPQAQGASRGLLSIAPLQAAAASSYEPEFFPAEAMETLDRLSELIIPADDHSGGASAAKVNRYIDVMVANGSETVQRDWRQGLAEVDSESTSRFGNAFRELDAAHQDAVMATMAADEGDPQTDLQRFFAQLKRMTIDGYYTSKIGIHDDLQYQGNTAVAEFTGCDHPEHQA